MKTLHAESIREKEKYATGTDYTARTLDLAIKEALRKVDYACETLGDRFASHCSVNNVYQPDDNLKGWNQGFWTGILWLSYELTGDEKYKNIAMGHIDSYCKRIEEAYERRVKDNFSTVGHDVGFLYSLSCVAAYKLTGDEAAKKAALMAADHLLYRYHEKGQFIQAWGQIGDPNAYRLIVDCLLNIPILYWASEVTGDPKYADAAYKHFRTTVDVAIREDASSFHTYYFDPQTGAPLKGVTKQGTSDDSCWSRGQAWIIYGMMLTRKYVNDPDAICICEAATNFYLNRLPKDYVPFWDLVFTEEDKEERDSSAAAIAMCGILELLKYLPEGDTKKLFGNAIDLTMESLYQNYSTKDCPESNGLLLHAVYSKPNHVGIDECNIWGCYFYLEALMRMRNPRWSLYW